MAVTAWEIRETLTPSAAELARRFARTPLGRELTGRERQVLALLAEGASTDAAASALYVSPATVKAHVRSILTKLGANNRTHAVAKLALAVSWDEEPDGAEPPRDERRTHPAASAAPRRRPLRLVC